MAYQDGDSRTYGGVTYLRQDGLWYPQPDPVLAAAQGGDGGAPGDGSQGNAPDASAQADPDQLTGQIAQVKDQFVNATDPGQKVNALWQLGSLIMAASQQPQQGGGSDGSGGSTGNPPQPAALFQPGQNQQNPPPFIAGLSGAPDDPAGALQQLGAPQGSDDGGNGTAQPPLPPPLLGQGSDNDGNDGSGIPLLPSDQQGPPPFIAGLPGAPGDVASALQQLTTQQGATAPGLGGGNGPQPPASLFAAGGPGGTSGGAQSGGLFGAPSQSAGPPLPPDQQNPPPFVAGLPGAPGDVASILQQLGTPQGAGASGDGPDAPQPPGSLPVTNAPGTGSDDQQQPGGLLGMPGQPVVPQAPAPGGPGPQGRPPFILASAQQPFQPNGLPPGGAFPGQGARGSQPPFGGAPAGFRLASLDSPSDGQAVLRTYGSPLDPVLGPPASIARAPIKGAPAATATRQPTAAPGAATPQPAQDPLHAEYNFQANTNLAVGSSKLTPDQKADRIYQIAKQRGRPLDPHMRPWLKGHANAPMIGNMHIGEVISLAQRGTRLRNRLMQFGFTPAAAAAMAANAMVESYGYYRSPQLSGGPGYGLWQWSPYRRGLYETLKKKQNKTLKQNQDVSFSAANEDDQIRFMIWEMQNQHPYHDAWAALHSNQSAGQMAAKVAMDYEGMANKTGDPEKRAAIADLLSSIPVDPRMNLAAPSSPPPEVDAFLRRKAASARSVGR